MTFKFSALYTPLLFILRKKRKKFWCHGTFKETYLLIMSHQYFRPANLSIGQPFVETTVGVPNIFYISSKLIVLRKCTWIMHGTQCKSPSILPSFLCTTYADILGLMVHAHTTSSEWGQFHVIGPRKKVNKEKWILFYEMWNLIGKFVDFGHFLKNFCNFGAFLAQIKKSQKMTVLKKWKFKVFSSYFC